MTLSLFRLLGGARSAPRAPRPTAERPRFRPTVESLERREVPSASPMAPPLAAAHSAAHSVEAAFYHAASVLPVTVTNVALEGGQLVAHGLIGSNPFIAPVTLTPATPETSATSTAAAAAASTPILDLQLGPIHLDVLGLVVDTSPICLDISATPGKNHLLGNLLTDIAGLLNSGTPLGDILGGLGAANTRTVTNGITSLLNSTLGDLTARSALSTSTAPTATNILNLSLGPVDLKLLGLDVHLDNCSGGPITLDVTAQPGPGNLLGNLLSGLAGVLNGTNLPTGAIDRILADFTREILSIL